MSSVSALNSLLSSSSGIDISSILQALTGSSSSGIDVNSAVSSSISAAQQPELNWEAQQSTLQSQATALTQLQNATTNLDNDVQALNSVTGPLSATLVSSSNAGIVTGSAASGSSVGNVVVVVNSLATTASWSSNTLANESTVLPPETFVITTASGATATITTGNGINNLDDLTKAINGENLGLHASVINDANGSRLAITSNNSGSASNFTVTSSDPSFSLTQAVAGTNASLQVNGISIASASNTVTGAVPGLTLNLLGASVGTEVSLSVSHDNSQASTAINQFVTDYNTLIGQLNTQFTDTGTGEGVLASDSSVRSLQSEILQALSYTAPPAQGSTTTVPNLSSLGISVNNDGTLSVNNATLNNSLQNNFSDVQNFFQGASLNGFANSLDQQLTSFISPADGAFTVDLKSISTEYSNLQDDINNFETNIITPLRTQLQASFSQAEIALQQLPSEIKNVDAELGLNNNNN
ncbi:MAG TPA: flagellar filament capping protein FliD [Acidobacteriaceae bacterium]|jgi:flagellar hook-associated protein 2|nr:flagellar filament capping protein FliD [Acidobacteriaceae bacterium]